MTVRLFESEPYRSEFEAIVEKVDGDWILLDQTCFYPGGGGQDPDIGWIDGLDVVEVKTEKDAIKHHVPGHRLQRGQSILGKVEWVRRYDLMKGHSGEHLLFGSIQKKVEDLELVKIAITPDKKMVMVRGKIDWEIISGCQRTVNDVIGKGIESEDIIVGRDSPLLEQARVKLDRIHGDTIRIVKFGDFDMAACSGVHVKNTKEIGMLLVTKFTSAKPAGDFEIEFEVGDRAIAKGLELSTLALEASNILGATTSTLLSSLTNQKDELARAKNTLRRYAKDAFARIEPVMIGDMRVYSGVFEGIDRKLLMDAANSIVEKSSSICAFAAEDEKLTLIVAASPDLGIDCTMVLNEVLKSISGKGGGSKTFATGGACARGEGSRLVDEAVKKACANR
ncbi:MAG: DHHA1 domain-containing protein [Methanomassiliicoccales archaeon]|jgi:alanyl-tRNA synthetase